MKKILILAGGYSNEREISLKTAKSVYSELLKLAAPLIKSGYGDYLVSLIKT